MNYISYLSSIKNNLYKHEHNPQNKLSGKQKYIFSIYAIYIYFTTQFCELPERNAYIRATECCKHDISEIEY